ELPEDVEDRLAHAVPRRPNGQPRGHLELSPPRLARDDPYFAHFTHAKRRPTATWRSYPSRHGRSSRMVDDPSRPRYAMQRWTMRASIPLLLSLLLSLALACSKSGSAPESPGREEAPNANSEA